MLRSLNRILMIIAMAAVIWNITQSGVTMFNMGAIVLLVFSFVMERYGAKKRAELEAEYAEALNQRKVEEELANHDGETIDVEATIDEKEYK